jgi:fumarate hydratase, class II
VLLRDCLQGCADAFAEVVKIARTHLMDAVPMTMGQAFDAFARQIGHGIDRVDAALPRLRVLPQGGTAAGTGLNAPPGFDAAFCEEVSARELSSCPTRASSRGWRRTTPSSKPRAR